MTKEQIKQDLENKLTAEAIAEIKRELTNLVLEEGKENFIINLIELSKQFNPNQILFLLASHIDYKLVWVLLNNKSITKKDIQDLINKGVIINKPNKEFDDAIFSDETTELIEKLISHSTESYTHLAEEFYEAYPSRHVGDKVLFIKKVTNLNMLLKQYIRNIQKDCKKNGKSIEVFHKEVIEKIKQNKDTINVNINSFVEGRAWNDLKINKWNDTI